MQAPVAPDFYIDDENPHLGGYIRGGDPATYFPELWDWLVAKGIRSVIDVGCGEGHAAKYFADLGCRVLGIDGVWQLATNFQFVAHDYTRGPLAVRDPYDLVWTCEFVEHVEERHLSNFLTTFQAANAVLMTHAEPGQPGHHHVNCQPAEYWIGTMAAAGFQYDVDFTREARAFASLNENPINHFARSGLSFTRRKWPDDFRGFGSNVQPKGQR